MQTKFEENRKIINLDVVTITYNSEKHLQRCLESVRINRRFIQRFIVIDGASNDGTIEILRNYLDIVSEIISEQDRGISDAFNKGIVLCSSEFILLLNSDDWFIDLNLEQVINNIATTDRIVCTRMQSFDAGLPMGLFNSNPSLIYKYNSMLHPGCIVSSDVYREIGLYDVTLRTAMDYDFFCRCFKSHINFRVIDIPLVAFNEGGTSRLHKYLILRESFALRKKYHGAAFPLHEIKQFISRTAGDFLDFIGLKNFFKKILRSI